MPNFEYKGIAGEGNKYTEGIIAAVNQDEAAFLLREKKIIITSLNISKGQKVAKKKDGGLFIEVEGPYSGVGQIAFYSKNEIEVLFDGLLKIEQLSHSETHHLLNGPIEVQAHWSIFARANKN